MYFHVLSNQSRASLANQGTKRTPVHHLDLAKVYLDATPGSDLDFQNLLQDPSLSHLGLTGALHKPAQHLTNFSSDRTQLLWLKSQKLP